MHVPESCFWFSSSKRRDRQTPTLTQLKKKVTPGLLPSDCTVQGESAKWPCIHHLPVWYTNACFTTEPWILRIKEKWVQESMYSVVQATGPFISPPSSWKMEESFPLWSLIHRSSLRITITSLILLLQMSDSYMPFPMSSSLQMCNSQWN